MNPRHSTKKRAVVLGAGPAGLSAALALVESGEYEVDVYQMGWRAGGKCATGRDLGDFRARQNGSHYLFGCYHNAFALIRRAHEVLQASSAPDRHQFGSFFGDFVARNLLVGAQGYQRLASSPGPDRGYWLRYLPQNMACPGEGGKFATPFDYALMMFQLSLGTLLDVYAAVVSSDTDEERFEGCRWIVRMFPLSPFERSLYARGLRLFLTPFRFAFNLLGSTVAFALMLLFRLWTLLVPMGLTRAMLERCRRSSVLVLAGLRGVGRVARAAALRQEKNVSNGMQRLVILFEIMLAMLVGFLTDELWRAGSFERIDALDLRAWLKKHGASEIACESSLVRTWYDATIAYEGGVQARASCSAGVAVQAMLRSLLTYKGAFAFQMRAEVGDSYIAPIVRALELLGVRFHFYHRVTELVVSSKTRAVEGLTLTQQIPDPPERTEFLDVIYGPESQREIRKGWPSVPLQAAGVGHPFPLDSYYSTCKHAAVSLERGADFDVVVCALPLGVVEDVLVDRERGRLADVAGPWRDAFREVRLTESQAIRMWFNVPLADLGWSHEPPILSGARWPHSTWEDNSQATEVHNFPVGQAPKTIATLFGPLETGLLDVRDCRHQALQQARAEQNAETFLEVSILTLWPGLAREGQVDWSKFIDLAGRQGKPRFHWQLVSANVGPNESYMVAWPGTLKFRPRPDESGYQHLFLAADWTRNGIEAGTVEAAVVSGLKAARAITGKSARAIVGADDFDYGTVLA